jgi:hypothetical protein
MRGFPFCSNDIDWRLCQPQAERCITLVVGFASGIVYEDDFQTAELRLKRSCDNENPRIHIVVELTIAT